MRTEGAPPAFWTPILYDVAHALESVDTPEVRVDRVLALMRRFVPYDHCALLDATPVLGRRISITPAISVEERDAMATRLESMLELLSPEGGAPALRSITGLPAAERAHLAVPLIAMGETTGVIFVERAASAYDESHLAFLSIIAAQIGAYLAAVRADRELRASEARFRGLYDSGVIGIAFMDARGAITDANEAFAAIVERPRAELQSHTVNWHAITPPGHRERDRTALRDAVEQGRCAPYEKRFVRADGRQATVVAGAARLESRDSLVAFALDVSEQRRIETERADLLKERESDIQLLEMFMGMLGHDLRNPLGAIRLSAEHLRRIDGGRVEKVTNRILSSTDRMARMVVQLLDLTRIRLAGGVPVVPSRVDLGEICRRAIDELKAAHPDASIRLEINGDSTGEWDGDRLLQVVSNLVANAIQHARETREITLRLTATEGSVELTAHNPGVIPADLMPVLFDPFRGAEVRGARKGLGLGLFITKHIVQAHGGSIDVASSEARGTIFTVRLPRRIRERSTSASASSAT